MKDYLDNCIEILLSSVPWLNLLPSGGVFLVKPDSDEDVLELFTHYNMNPRLLTLCKRVPFGKCHCGKAALDRKIQFSDCVDDRHEIQFDGMVQHGHYNIPIMLEGKVLGVIVLYLPHGYVKNEDSISFLTRVANILSMGISKRYNNKILEKALVQAEQANLIKSEFLATMSHEFRTPLNAILGFSDMMREQLFGPLGSNYYTDYADHIHSSGKHMLALVNDILDISTIEAGKRTLSIEPCSMGELVQESLSNVDQASKVNNLALLSHIQSNLPLFLADVRSMRQILLNLLSNAIKFTNPNGKILVTVGAIDSKMTIKVSDTGIGIPANNLTKITEPFYQLHSDPHKTQDGTGLGLSIVRSLVDAHDGNMHIKSEIGKGTTVTVAFPFQPPGLEGY